MLKVAFDRPKELLMQSQIDDWQAAYNKSRDGGVKVRSKYEQLKDDGFEDDGFEEVEVRASDSKAAVEASNSIEPLIRTHCPLSVRCPSMRLTRRK